jgi:hypothetical protein
MATAERVFGIVFIILGVLSCGFVALQVWSLIADAANEMRLSISPKRAADAIIKVQGQGAPAGESEEL